MNDQPWTIKRLLDWTADFFKTKNIESARLSAEILLAESLHCQRIDLYTQFERVPDQKQLAVFRDWVKRHASGEPVAYLVGHKEFYSLKFVVDSHVLIPRPETEHVVVAAVEAGRQLAKSQPQLVDIGTGSGCIAITLATILKDCQIFASDISRDAIEIARRNANSHQLTSPIQFAVGHLFDPWPAEQRFDLVVSNPPYIGRSEIDTVDHSVKEFEPDIALFSGEDGLDVIRELIPEAAKRLNQGGHLVFEISPVVVDRSIQLIESCKMFRSPEVIKDFAGRARVINAQKI